MSSGVEAAPEVDQRWQAAREFIEGYGVHIISIPFDAFDRLKGDGWDAEVTGETLTLKENNPNVGLSRTVRFKTVDQEGTHWLKAAVTRSKEEQNPRAPLRVVERVHSIRSEGNFIMVIWGPTGDGSLERRQAISIGEKGTIRFNEDEQLPGWPNNQW